MENLALNKVKYLEKCKKLKQTNTYTAELKMCAKKWKNENKVQADYWASVWWNNAGSCLSAHFLMTVCLCLKVATVPSAQSLHLLDFSFSDFELSDAETTLATIRMFVDLDLIQNFQMKYTVRAEQVFFFNRYINCFCWLQPASCSRLGWPTLSWLLELFLHQTVDIFLYLNLTNRGEKKWGPGNCFHSPLLVENIWWFSLYSRNKYTHNPCVSLHSVRSQALYIPFCLGAYIPLTLAGFSLDEELLVSLWPLSRVHVDLQSA